LPTPRIAPGPDTTQKDMGCEPAEPVTNRPALSTIIARTSAASSPSCVQTARGRALLSVQRAGRFCQLSATVVLTASR
jgi:hypothetical protein